MGNGVEVELAVARGDTYLHKARFRPSAILTVGSNPMTTVTLDGGDIPDFLEFLNVTPEGAVLRFAQDTSVEVLSGSQVLSTKALMDGGYAKRTGEAFSVNLEVGGKAVVRMGDFKLMLKVEPTSDSEVFTVKAQEMDAAPCGKCGTNLRLILSGGGALTPCSACGALNQVSLAGTRQQQFEEQATRIAMPTGVLGDPPAGAPEQIDPQSSTGRAVGDLPTFDAISVLKDSEGGPAGAAEAIQNLGLEGGQDKGIASLGPAPAPEPAPAPAAASGGNVDPGSSTGRAASDLPTFDAIAVLKEDAPEQQRPATVNLAGGDAPPAAPPQEQAPAPTPAPAVPPQAPPTPAPAPAAEAPPAAAPEPQAAPAPAPAAPAPQEEAPVSTPEQPEPTPPAPAAEAAPAPSSDGEYSPSTGQWEETLTIAAVKPKSKSILPWIILMVLAVLGFIGLVAAVVVFKFVL